MSAGRRARWPAALLLAVCAACGSARTATPPPTSSTDDRAAVLDARAFLAADVAGDGRSVRADQGGDTVSEGQGYALLLALSVGDAPTFARVWTWTQGHLQRPDGLFAYRWAGGGVADPEPAADADVQIAWALDLAGQRFHEAAYVAQARRVASAVATQEIGYDDAGSPTLAAGPWARAEHGPTTVEPGYWTYPADAALAALTGDHRWQSLAAADRQHLVELTGNGGTLPADWARLGGGSGPAPTTAPDGAGVASGQDGLRAVVWQQCTADPGRLATAWWSLLGPDAAAAPLTRSLAGAPTQPDVSALGAVAAAAAAQGAGHAAQAAALLARADEVQQRFPTYYGGAWAALGRVLLTTDRLGRC